jgi:4-amino-4-deoxy-L-arabinose transferase-like glycosyltransferase
MISPWTREFGRFAHLAAAKNRPSTRLVASGCALAACAVFLLADLQTFPIQLWDESRLAVNAIEMYHSGLGLITTYDFVPDHWNTKAPLLIWLMTTSMWLFSPSELALRLPSALAALATLAVVMGFTWRLTYSLGTALLAGSLLVASYGFHGHHAAATGDYDATLGFFSTAYICMLFFTLHRRRPRPGQVLAVGGLITCAVLTKNISGLIPGTGVVAYILLMRRWTRPVQSLWYTVSGLLAVLVLASFYGLREVVDPGYLAALMQNELMRYFEPIEGANHDHWYFVVQICAHLRFIAGPLAVVAPLGLIVARGRVRLGLLYSSCIAFCLIATYSFAATLHPWYMVPTYPFLAIALALAIHASIRPISGVVARKSKRLGHAVENFGRYGIILATLLLFGGAVYQRYWSKISEFHHDANYGVLFADLHRQGIREVRVVDAGDEGWRTFGYTPRLRFYSLLWADKGLAITDVVPKMAMPRGRPGDVVVTCDQRYTSDLTRYGEKVAEISACVAVRL